MPPGPWRDTSKARAARTRTKHDRWAAEMRESGWGVTTPEEMRGDRGEMREGK